MYRFCESFSLLRWFLTGVIVFALVSSFAWADQAGRRFYPDDPIATEPETQDASKVSAWEIELLYDLVLNVFTKPGLPSGSRARNINTIDEVPDSSWFTNRILARPLSIEEAVRGPLTGQGPAPGQLTVTRAKAAGEGAAPGFTVRDSAGVTWFLAFDPKSNPEASTAAAVIAMRIFWALGYHQAEYYISELSREQLQIDKNAKFHPPSGKIRSMTLKDIDPVLERAARKPNGSYRILASRALPGKVLGGFKYHGTRPDDPNDVIPHDERRELRALHVFGAWTNLVDLKALNTMDTLIVENGRSRVRHYLLDVGSAFGMGANGPREWFEGNEYIYQQDKALKRLATFGFYIQPWQTVRYEKNRSIGRFEGDRFDPVAWKSRVPAAALLHIRDDDAFWAARRVMAFTDEMIRALVKTGRYSDPTAEELLAKVLIKRRDKIGQTYFTRVNPLIDLSLDTGVLKFTNAAVNAGFAKEPASYKAAWFSLDNETGAASPVGVSSGSNGQIAAPANLAGAYIVAEIHAEGTPYASWQKPVRATFRRDSDKWKLVGFERLPEARSALKK